VVDLFQIILAHAAMTFLRPFIVAGLLLSLGACALPPEYPAFGPNASEQKAVALMSELSRVAALSAEQRRREVAALDAIRRPDPARRFQLAALLERDDNLESLERSLKTLNAMPEDDARTQALVELMKRSLKARIELRQQTARNVELQDKLEQIKTLEKSLQQRTTPSGTP
jgi:hypothetical protein